MHSNILFIKKVVYVFFIIVLLSSFQISAAESVKVHQELVEKTDDLQISWKTTLSFPRDLAISSDDRNLYVLNEGNNTISMATRVGESGKIRALTPPIIATGIAPYKMEISSDGKNVYVLNKGAENKFSTLSVYSRDTSNGLLKEINGSPMKMEHSFDEMISTFDGKFMYFLSNSKHLISMFRREQESGNIIPLSPSTIEVGGFPRALTISADGKSIYILNDVNSKSLSLLESKKTVREESPDISWTHFARDQNTGLLTLESNGPVGDVFNPTSITISKDGKNVFITNFKSSFSQTDFDVKTGKEIQNTWESISVFKRDVNNGKLTKLVSPKVFNRKSAFNGDFWSRSLKIISTEKFFYLLSNPLEIFQWNQKSEKMLPLKSQMIQSEFFDLMKASYDGKFMYGINSRFDNLTIHRINQTTGILKLQFDPMVGTCQKLTNPSSVQIPEIDKDKVEIDSCGVLINFDTHEVKEFLNTNPIEVGEGSLNYVLERWDSQNRFVHLLEYQYEGSLLLIIDLKNGVILGKDEELGGVTWSSDKNYFVSGGVSPVNDSSVDLDTRIWSCNDRTLKKSCSVIWTEGPIRQMNYESYDHHLKNVDWKDNSHVNLVIGSDDLNININCILNGDKAECKEVGRKQLPPNKAIENRI